MMEGIVNISIDFLQVLNDKLHLTLNSAKIKYVAQTYAIPMKHPGEELYALVLTKKPLYLYIIMNTLNDDEKAMIQELGPEWFPELPIE